MQNERIDLNLLEYLDVLLRERNVTRAASYLGLSQPAMSNGLRRLRLMFNDPLLVRTSEGMTPTERALELQPLIREALAQVDKAIQPQAAFEPATTERVFRIMASDYAESTIIPRILHRLREEAPGIVLDIMTPSDVSFLDVEQGKVDMVINRFDSIPQSFHQKLIWNDSFTCLFSAENPIRDNFNDPDDVQRLGWVDEALTKLGKKRHITIFTRHYQAAMLLAEQKDLIVTLPTRAAHLKQQNPRVIMREPPFSIPAMELKMAWSPLLQNNPGHQWMRRLIVEVTQSQD